MVKWLFGIAAAVIIAVLLLRDCDYTQEPDGHRFGRVGTNAIK